MPISPFPDNVRTVGVVAMAGKLNSERVERGVATLATYGVKCRLADSVRQPPRHHYLASPARQRADELTKMWLDPEVDLILNARGGYGSAQTLPLLDWDALRSRELPFLGYSDITCMHLAFFAKGVGSPVAAPVLQEFPGVAADDYTLGALRSCLDSVPGPPPLPPGKRLQVLKDGEATGPLIPVTLSVLVTLFGTPFMPDLRGTVLLLEDVNEPPYKLDRYLTQLRQTGVVDACAGILLGYFKGCGHARHRNELFAAFAAAAPCPVVAGVPFGHSLPRLSFRVGGQVAIRPGGVVETCP